MFYGIYHHPHPAFNEQIFRFRWRRDIDTWIKADPVLRRRVPSTHSVVRQTRRHPERWVWNLSTYADLYTP